MFQAQRLAVLAAFVLIGTSLLGACSGDPEPSSPSKASSAAATASATPPGETEPSPSEGGLLERCPEDKTYFVEDNTCYRVRPPVSSTGGKQVCPEGYAKPTTFSTLLCVKDGEPANEPAN